MFRSAVVAVATITALSTAVVDGAGSRAAGAPSGRILGIPKAPQSDSIAVGTVTVDGKPLPGATLRVEAWPDESVLATLPEGAAVPVRQVDLTRTDANGGFSLDVDFAALPAGFVDAHGAVDFAVTADSGARRTTWNLSAARPSTAATNGLSGVAISGSRPEVLRFELGNEPGVGSALAPASAAVGLPTGAVTSKNLWSVPAAATATRTAAVAAAPCNSIAGAWENGKSEKYAVIYAWTGARATISQTNGATHTLGVAAQVGTGAWRQSGTANFDESTGAGATRSGVVDARVENKVNYRNFALTCAPYTKTKKAVSTFAFFTAFTRVAHRNFAASQGCTRYTGGTYVKTRGTNTTQGAAINLGVVTLTAQSGWNTETQIQWTVTQPTQLCGSTAQGWVQSPEAETHQA